jgi:dynein heavy chain
MQDKVINSITELYTFMDTSDATLGLKVLGEGGDEEENAGHGEHQADHAGAAR